MAIQRVRDVILQNLPAGYEEGMQYGMIGYYVPLARYPETYNRQPLTLAALASQKGYMSLYLMGVYGDPQLRRQLEQEYQRSGKRFAMGKSCLRFKSLDELALDVVGKVIARTSVEQLIAQHGASHAGRSSRGRSKTAPAPTSKPALAARRRK